MAYVNPARRFMLAGFAVAAVEAALGVLALPTGLAPYLFACAAATGWRSRSPRGGCSARPRDDPGDDAGGGAGARPGRAAAAAVVAGVRGRASATYARDARPAPTRRSIDFRPAAGIGFARQRGVCQTFPAIEEETVVADQRQQHRGVAYEDVGDDYLDKRQLKSGAAGWVLLAGLGVAYVISGDFAGWNFGLAEGGWGGLLIATILMGIMYTCMIFSLAELSSTIPTAGGGYGFARRAMGPLGGFATGTAILIEYAIAPAAIVMFIGGYIEALADRHRQRPAALPRRLRRSSSASTCAASARR